MVRRPKPSKSPRAATSTSSGAFRGGRSPGPNDVFIAVMGVTGSGKSSFISLCSGNRSVKIGHDLTSCTSAVDVYAYDVSPGRTVYLIDTPGFDDTNKSDTEVLSEIAAWLADSYRNEILLHGIIYLHKITDNRMESSAKKNFLMFRQLCGPDALKKVILVTTMWDRVTNREGTAREKELINTQEFWGWMAANGSSCHRHNNTESSAQGAVALLANHNKPITTDLQRQLVDEHRTLDQTSAGQEMHSEMLKEKAKWAKELREVEQQMQAAIQQRDRKAEEVMREERDRFTHKIKKVEKDTDKLRSTMETLLADRDKRVSRMEKELQEQREAHKEELRRVEERARKIREERDELEEEREQQEKLMKRALEKAERQAKREREKAEKQAQRQREEKAQQKRNKEAQITQPSTSATSTTYSVSMVSQLLICSSPSQISSTCGDAPSKKKGSAWLDAVSLGDSAKVGSTTWIVRYTDGTWVQSTSLETEYPHLGARITKNGLNNLEYCALGPGQRYYARWKSGVWSYWACESEVKALKKWSTAKDGSKVVAVAFGRGEAYVVSYGWGYKNLGHTWKLMNNYANLEKLLVDRKDIGIMAVTLDPLSTTDYVVVYWDPVYKGGRVRVNWTCTNEANWGRINTWWNKTCGV